MTKLVWFRRDLRITDNPALSAACETAGERVIALFIITPQAWRKHHNSPCQIELILRTLHELQQELQQLNVPLLIRSTAEQKTQAIIEKVIATHKVTEVFYNIEYEVDELARDKIIKQRCEKFDVTVHDFHDQLFIPPGTLKNKSAEPYKVFTPFKKALYAKWHHSGIPPMVANPKTQARIKVVSDNIPTKLTGFTTAVDPACWPAGTKVVHQRLAAFCQQRIMDYQAKRDYPCVDNTSQLSPYLAIGALSIRECLYAALDSNKGEWDSGDKGVMTWVSELVWREFYRHILIEFPRVCRHQPFQLATKKIRWSKSEKNFKRWCDGETGVPIIDAAMRQLQQTGWVHNRLRMVVAMFLAKNLLIHWRWGEEFFMQHLIDGDFASNNGGWQWSASTGTDAAPYFRIMNPVSQSERFDGQGEFIRQYLPELTELDNKAIHHPSARCDHLPKNYPKIMVDLKQSRQQAINVFKKTTSRQ